MHRKTGRVGYARISTYGRRSTPQVVTRRGLHQDLPREGDVHTGYGRPQPPRVGAAPGAQATHGRRTTKPGEGPTSLGAARHSRRPHQRHRGTGIWRDRDIAAGSGDIETPCAALPTRSPSRPRTPARKAGILDLRKRMRARDGLSAGGRRIRTLGPPRGKLRCETAS
jgi:hypothetical protein